MRILLRFSGAFAAACMLALCLTGPWLGIGLGLTAAAALLLFRRRPLGILALGLGLGLLWTLGYRQVAERPVAALEGGVLEIFGTATDYSTPTAYGVRVPAVISDGDSSVRAMVWLDTEEELSPGDGFTVSAALQEASSYYRSQGILLLAYGRGTPELSRAEAVPLRYLPRRIAHRLEQSLEACVPEDAVGYAVALVTGNRTGLTNLQREQLKAAGIYHMLALSGLHMTVLVGIVACLLRRKRHRAMVGIPLCVAFAVVTGASPSVVRAAVMQCMVLAAPLLGREEDTPTSLGVAALGMAVHDPFCLLNWGLQLSFASMAGLLLLSDRIYGALDRRLGKGRPLSRAVLASLSSVLGATACSAPLLMAYYGSLSLASPLTNLLTGWMVAWCFRGSLLTALVGLVLPTAGTGLGWLLAWGIRYIQAVAAILSRVPVLSAGSIYGNGWVCLVYVLAAVTVLSPKGKRRVLIPACCAASALGVCLLLTALPVSGLELTALDVGQGQCLIFTCGSQTAVVDCGGSYGDGCGDLAAEALAGRGRVDVLLVTHYDSDHIGGVEELLQRVPVSLLLLPDMEQESRQALVASAQAAGTEVLLVDRRMSLSLGSGEITVFPPVDPLGGNGGLSLLARSGEFRVLVTGDMDTEQEALLLRQQTLPEVDILVAGHHGAASGTSQALLDATAPKAVVISVGENNYGQPAQATLERIMAAGAAIYRTDQYGTVRLKGA